MNRQDNPNVTKHSETSAYFVVYSVHHIRDGANPTQQVIDLLHWNVTSSVGYLLAITCLTDIHPILFMENSSRPKGMSYDSSLYTLWLHVFTPNFDSFFCSFGVSYALSFIDIHLVVKNGFGKYFQAVGHNVPLISINPMWNI